MNKEYLLHIFKYIEKHPEEKENVLDNQHIPIKNYLQWKQYLGME